jgi:methionyl-tRNA formyltransferase
VRLVVLAYQEIGYVCLESLLRHKADVALVLSHRDDADEENLVPLRGGIGR